LGLLSEVCEIVRHKGGGYFCTYRQAVDFQPFAAGVGATALALLDESGMPTAPINARTTKNAMMKGAILGLGVWFALVLLMALSKTTIHHEDMLRTYLSFECFGQIPQVKITAKDPCPLMTQIRRRPEFSEAIRSLRMRVERSMDQDDKKVLLISSAIPGEGKSTISINLAISMAQRGKRVLLIDCDLRNPSVAKGLKIRSDCSLTDYLLGRMTLKELLRPTDIDNLYIIPGGSGDPKAADLLNQERGLGMIHAARNLFDFVILDTPPCSMLADTGEVAALADAGLLVVRQDFASRGQILDGVQRMGDADLPMIGWVFNHTKRSLSYNYGTYGYTYGYGYGKK
jgi:receptor protein-tyrosine kinase